MALPPPEASSDETGPSEDLQSGCDRGEKRKGHPTSPLTAAVATTKERQTTPAGLLAEDLDQGTTDDLELDTLRPAGWSNMSLKKTWKNRQHSGKTGGAGGRRQCRSPHAGFLLPPPPIPPP